MKFFNFFRRQKKKQNAPPPNPDDILHLWEDDHLMIELLPNENIDFVKAETKRINQFGQEHFNGHGFTAVTPIGEVPFKTIEKLIDISEAETLITQTGLKKIDQFIMQNVGLLEGERKPLGFGTKNFAILCEREGLLLRHVWITGRAETADEKRQLSEALLLLGTAFGLMVVNWFCDEYYNLVEKTSVEEFVASI